MTKLLACATTFALIVLCELGDKTQVATLLYASNNPGKKWQVFAAAGAALVACVCLEVTVGIALAKVVEPWLINRITGVVFLAIGLYAGAGLAWQARRRRASTTMAQDGQTAAPQDTGDQATENSHPDR